MEVSETNKLKLSAACVLIKFSLDLSIILNIYFVIFTSKSLTFVNQLFGNTVWADVLS